LSGLLRSWTGRENASLIPVQATREPFLSGSFLINIDFIDVATGISLQEK
jgi:hypothetical protein